MNCLIDKSLSNIGDKFNVPTMQEIQPCYVINEHDICQCNFQNIDNITKPTYSTDYDPININTFSKHICGIESNCCVSDVFKILFENYNQESNLSILDPTSLNIYDDKKMAEIYGGVKQVVKKKTQAIEKSKEHIEYYGKLVIKELGSRFGILGNRITEDDIANIITKLSITNKQINLNTDDLYYIYIYVKENYNKVTLEKFYTDHSLYSIMKLTDVDMNEQLYQLNALTSSIKYKKLIEASRLISDQFIDISSHSGQYGKTIHYSQTKNMIDPLFAALFLIKLPVLEDLIITEDYYTLVKDVRQKKVSKNTMLFMLRTSDPLPLNVIGSNHKNPISTEIMRIAISQALRKIAVQLRQGIFYSDVAEILQNMLTKIITPYSKTEDESVLHAILKTFSFDPTLIKSSNLTMHLIPKSVPSVSYDITAGPYPTNVQFIINSKALDSMVFNPDSGKLLMFPYQEDASTKIDENSIMMKIMANMANIIPSTVQANNIIGPFINKHGFNLPESRFIKTDVYLSNGVFFISIPRLIKKSFDPMMPFNSTSDKLNNSPIDVEDVIQIGNTTFELKSAVCYITKEDTRLFGLSLCSNIKPIGKIALIKTEKGWFKYDTSFLVSPINQQKQYKRGLQNLFRSTINQQEELVLEDDDFDERYKTWVCDPINGPRKDLKLQQMERGEFKVDDFFIGKDEVNNFLKYYSTILVYSENYENYNKRLIDDFNQYC